MTCSGCPGAVRETLEEAAEGHGADLESLLAEKGFHNAIHPEYLEIGGFLYRDRAFQIEYSCSLDERLADQIEWFRNHSGFKVTESGENA